MENFEKNVFVNCPFDKDYMYLLKPLLFTILYCGYKPRIASERFDSGESRITKIKELIDSSKYSIHDLSRIKSKVKNEYFRMNMPFEIGLDLGCRLYHPDSKYHSKRSLILESEQYSYQKALSDLSNSDVKCHNGIAEDMVFEIRSWFLELNNLHLTGGTIIWDDYNAFFSFLFNSMKLEGLSQKDIDKMPIAELVNMMISWIKDNATKPVLP